MFGNALGHDGLRCCQHLQKVLALWIRLVLKIQPASGVALAGQQGIGKALRLAKCIAALQQAHQGRCVQIVAAVDVAVLARHNFGNVLAVQRHAQALAHLPEQAHAAHFVANMARQHIGWRRAFAQVVHQAGKAHRQRRFKLRGHVEHHHQMHTGIDLRMVLGPLRHAPEPVNFGQQPRQRAAFTQYVEHAGRFGLHQSARDFLPNALGHQRIYFTIGHHGFHELHGFRRHAEIGKTGCKARQTQDAHRVFAERIADVAQHFMPDVLLP